MLCRHSLIHCMAHHHDKPKELLMRLYCIENCFFLIHQEIIHMYYVRLWRRKEWQWVSQLMMTMKSIAVLCLGCGNKPPKLKRSLQALFNWLFTSVSKLVLVHNNGNLCVFLHGQPSLSWQETTFSIFIWNVSIRTRFETGKKETRKWLPPMWPGFDSRTRRHMWVEFVVVSLLCSARFFSGYSGFPLSSKTNIFKFQFDPGMHGHILNEFLRTPRCSVGKQITFTFTFTFGKRGHIVADTNVSPFARARNICCGYKFCVRDSKNVSDFVQKHFVSATGMFPSLHSP